MTNSTSSSGLMNENNKQLKPTSYKLTDDPIKLSNLDEHIMVYSAIDACLRYKYLASQKEIVRLGNKDKEQLESIESSMKKHISAMKERFDLLTIITILIILITIMMIMISFIIIIN